jgi:hypothetical protein
MMRSTPEVFLRRYARSTKIESWVPTRKLTEERRTRRGNIKQ